MCRAQWRENRLEEINEVGHKTRDYFFGSPEKSRSPKRENKKSKATKETLSSTLYSPDKRIKTKGSPPRERVQFEDKQLGQNAVAFLTETSYNENTEPRIGYQTGEKFNSAYVTHLNRTSPSIKRPTTENRPLSTSVSMRKKEKKIGVKEYLEIIAPTKQNTTNRNTVRQLFKARVFERVTHTPKNENLNMTGPILLFRKDLNETTDGNFTTKETTVKYSRTMRSEKPWKRPPPENRKHIASKIVERKIRPEEEKFSQIEAKEKVLKGIIKGEELRCDFFDFSELLKLHKPQRPGTAVAQTNESKTVHTYYGSDPPTIVERVLQVSEVMKEYKRPTTPQIEKPFVNIHMKAMREKNGPVKNRPRFLSHNIKKPLTIYPEHGVPVTSTSSSPQRYSDEAKVHIRSLNASMM